MRMTVTERKWLNSAPVGHELELLGPKGIISMGTGYSALERGGYIRVERDHHGMKITRIK